MSEFTVYSVPGSPFGRAVLATLEEKAASYRLLPVAPGTLRSPEHLARHPFGRIPVLEHDGFSLYETQAILRYLDRVLPSPALSRSTSRVAARPSAVDRPATPEPITTTSTARVIEHPQACRWQPSARPNAGPARRSRAVTGSRRGLPAGIAPAVPG